MLNVESYRPKKEVASKTRDFSIPKKSRDKTKKFGIKNDPKVIFRTILYSLTSAGLLFAIVFSAYKIIRWQAETDATNELIRVLQNSTVISITTEEENQTIEDPTTLIEADITSLKTSNNDTVGWIYLPGTSINYPFVQTTNNDFYLRHSFNQRWNTAGWVFLDYRNSKNMDDRNQIIYAHGRIDGSMFGTLESVITKEWQEKKENHFVKTVTEESSSLWQVFSTYETENTTDYLITNFNNDTQFENFLSMIKNRSNYNYHIDVATTDKIITLSTCTKTNGRIVLHAKLIKRQ